MDWFGEDDERKPRCFHTVDGLGFTSSPTHHDCDSSYRASMEQKGFMNTSRSREAERPNSPMFALKGERDTKGRTVGSSLRERTTFERQTPKRRYADDG